MIKKFMITISCFLFVACLDTSWAATSETESIHNQYLNVPRLHQQSDGNRSIWGGQLAETRAQEQDHDEMIKQIQALVEQNNIQNNSYRPTTSNNSWMNRNRNANIQAAPFDHNLSRTPYPTAAYLLPQANQGHSFIAYSYLIGFIFVALLFKEILLTHYLREAWKSQAMHLGNHPTPTDHTNPSSSEKKRQYDP